MIDSGKLRHRVTWISLAETVTDGKISTTPTTQGTYWAFVDPKIGTETTVNNKVQAVVTYTVKMRMVGDVKAKDKLIYKSRTLQVESVINSEEQGYELIISCKELVA